MLNDYDLKFLIRLGYLIGALIFIIAIAAYI